MSCTIIQYCFCMQVEVKYFLQGKTCVSLTFCSSHLYDRKIRATQTVTCHLNPHYRCTVGLERERILISLDKVVLGWAVLVAVVQLSPGPMCTTSILFCMYLQSVTVCCDISTGSVRQTDLYGTFYMGLFFDMRVSTYLIPLLQCPIKTYSLQSVCMYGIPFRLL